MLIFKKYSKPTSEFHRPIGMNTPEQDCIQHGGGLGMVVGVVTEHGLGMVVVVGVVTGSQQRK